MPVHLAGITGNSLVTYFDQIALIIIPTAHLEAFSLIMFILSLTITLNIASKYYSRTNEMMKSIKTVSDGLYNLKKEN